MAVSKKIDSETEIKSPSKKRIAKTASTELSKKSIGFKQHIQRIKKAKKLADDIAENTPMDTCEASVALLWEIVFDNLCNAEQLSMSDFNTVAGIIQKLASTKVRDVTNKISIESENTLQNFMLTEETLAKIESQLKML